MKRTGFLFLCLLGCMSCCLWAQDSAAALDRRAEEERYRILTAKITSLLETQELILKHQDTFQKSLDALAREIDKVKDENARGAVNLVGRDELKSLVKTVQEIDEKREADKKLILQSIKDLAKVSLAVPNEMKEIKETKAPLIDRAPSELPYEYEVKKGDTLQEIVAAYNEEFKSRGDGTITLEQVLKENPSLRPDRIRSGQKIAIPVPAKK